jgi:hypothetical protein
MLRSLQNITNEHNWLYIYMRFGIMLVAGVVIFLAQERVWYGIESISDILTALGIGTGLTLILVVPTLVKMLRLILCILLCLVIG